MQPQARGSTINGSPTVQIHYRRPPDREEIFVQTLVHRSPEVVVTLLERTPLRRPVMVDGRVVLEDGSPVVWFTFPGERHDIGRFHTVDGRFTGIYANILTPVRFLDATTWETTDLFLDIWLEPEGRVRILDRDELAAARQSGWIDDATAEEAEREAARIVELAQAGAWPPPVVAEWTLERAREAIRD